LDSPYSLTQVTLVNAVAVFLASQSFVDNWSNKVSVVVVGSCQGIWVTVVQTQFFLQDIAPKQNATAINITNIFFISA